MKLYYYNCSNLHKDVKITIAAAGDYLRLIIDSCLLIETDSERIIFFIFSRHNDKNKGYLYGLNYEGRLIIPAEKQFFIYGIWQKADIPNYMLSTVDFESILYNDTFSITSESLNYMKRSYAGRPGIRVHNIEFLTKLLNALLESKGE